MKTSLLIAMTLVCTSPRAIAAELAPVVKGKIEFVVNGGQVEMRDVKSKISIKTIEIYKADATNPIRILNVEKNSLIATDSKGAIHTAVIDAEKAPSVKCPSAFVPRSECEIRVILADTAKLFGALANGGISEVKALSSTSYRVTVPEEERPAVLIYDIATTDKGRTYISHRKQTTEAVK